MNSAGGRDDPEPLDLRICVIEQPMLERRQRIGSVVQGIQQRSRARVISPGVLTAVFGFGVFLRRTRDRRTWSLMTLLNAACTSISLVMTVSSWLSPVPRASAGDETGPSRT